MLADSCLVADVSEGLIEKPGGGSNRKPPAEHAASKHDIIVISSDSDIEIGKSIHNDY